MTASTDRAPLARDDDDAAGGRGRRALRVVVVGMSTGETCGVHDHAALLAEALARENVSCTLHWLNRSSLDFSPSRAEISTWAHELEDKLARERPDAVVLHYSVFAHSQRGVPVFVPAMLRGIRRSGIPLITFLHEFRFRQRGRSGPQGLVWAFSQRAALLAVMRASAAAVVTIEERVGWLRARRWLPARPLAVAPVFSTLPAPGGDALNTPDREPPRVGLFGYTYPDSAVALVLDALALVRARGCPAGLVLLGSPGPDSAVGQMWTAAARERSLSDALSYSGTVSAQQLSNMLAECELLLFADRPGPTSRKTTLAGALASGTAVVATDGPSSWSKLLGAGVLEVAQPRAEDLAEALERLLGDRARRQQLGARGRDFAAQSMGLALSATVLAELLDDVVPAAQTGVGAAPAGDGAPTDSQLARASR
jgi:glycosyltransferase involved in cell wall biosynthesis